MDTPDQMNVGVDSAARSTVSTAAEKWSLTKEAFDKLLGSFGTDRESAAVKYLEIRVNLTRFFEWRGCPFPEEHADETFNRVAKKVSQGEEIRSPAAYVIGVARLLVLEIMRAHSRQREAFGEYEASRTEPEDASDSEARIECLQRCLQELSSDNRRLIIEYYEGDKGVKIENRRKLGTRLGLTINTLRMRAQRVRERLQICVEECLNQK
jgi:RNA polymerase sigma factor (sigma-70 family)